MKGLKNKKQLVLNILLDVFICIVTFIILFFSLNKPTAEISSPTNTISNTTETNNSLTVILGNTSEDNEEVTEIVTDEKASDKELKEEKVSKKEEKKSTSPYFIKVNYKANVVTIYTKDKDGKYTVPYKAMVCSCGTYTPKSGTYKTSSKHRWGKLIHDVYGQYATRIVGSILFHSVPYSSNSADTLLYDEYDKLGTTASAGCIRLSVKDCKWIYDNCPRGTMVEFYSDSTPGPLGKPTSQKISSVLECRNWDPTDPAAENPWHTYKKEEEKPSEDISNNITNDVTNDVSNNVINNVVNENITNSVDNSIDNNISNENTNNPVVDNSTVDNSSSSNNAITDTNSTVSNNTVDNNIDNNTVNNSTTDNNTVDSSNNSDNTESSDNSISDENVTTGDSDNSSQNSNDTDNNVNNQIINNTAENIM